MACTVAGQISAIYNSALISIEQYIRMIETHSCCGIVRAVYPIGVDLAMSHPFDKYVPVMKCLVQYRMERNDLEGAWIIETMKQKQFHCSCMLRKQGKVYAVSNRVGAERIRFSVRDLVWR